MITNFFLAQKISKMKGILLKCSKKAQQDLKTGNTLVIASWGYKDKSRGDSHTQHFNEFWRFGCEI